MNDDIKNVCIALDNLAAAVISAWGADNTVCENVGWYGPAVTRYDLAEIAKTLAIDLRSTDGTAIPSTLLQLIKDLPRRLQILQSNTVPQMFGSNAGQAIPAYGSTDLIETARGLPSAAAL